MKIIEIITEVAHRFDEAELFYGHGTDNSADEAFALVFHHLKLPFDSSEAVYMQEVSAPDQLAIFALAMERIKTKKPLPYLTHAAYFAGLEFYVDERVIVPRSPFAELIEEQFQPWIQSTHVTRILDLCTGSGCMAIAAAHYFPDALVDAVELSSEALEVAKINVEKHQLSQRVSLIQSDLFDQLPNHHYDIIMSNPPYVSSEEMKALPSEFLHEPNISLEANDEGLSIVNRILADAKKRLNDGGILVVEVGNSQAALEKRFPHMPFIWLDFENGGDGVFLLEKKDL